MRKYVHLNDPRLLPERLSAEVHLVVVDARPNPTTRCTSTIRAPSQEPSSAEMRVVAVDTPRKCANYVDFDDPAPSPRAAIR